MKPPQEVSIWVTVFLEGEQRGKLWYSPSVKAIVGLSAGGRSV